MSGMPASLHWAYVGVRAREAAYQGGRYQIYPWKGGWTFNRSAHPLLPEFDGVVTSEREAKMLCQNDYKKVARVLSWVQYILDNDPPPRRKLGCCNGGPQWGHDWNCHMGP
ncbi:Uncharacterised protein [Mycobacteroides abscessus subsp. abscessus]|nr:Uncharacterised protein [Mycobacteroides abscessus subsp. abscessus]SIH29899.1 Uncharacterised protein [Mycobacteroides abscessus subsp. abscessus]SKN43171.1 Uncharacterised protein [Mycobacteroides abscessus subsp. abscessus]SLB69747.1 Uncharacterised protein [Mycobacteroides abscessus subsp. abscessus]